MEIVKKKIAVPDGVHTSRAADYGGYFEHRIVQKTSLRESSFVLDPRSMGQNPRFDSGPRLQFPGLVPAKREIATA
jgi:hypothetical protein